MDAAHADRSKLVQKQKQQRGDAEKKVKKLKGAMKEAAQKELEELDIAHEAELAEFDNRKGVSGSEKTVEKSAPVEDSAPKEKFRDRNWSGLSKKELEEEAVLRGLGKKGSKEDLITKLTLFQQEQAMQPTYPEGPPAAAAGKASKASKSSSAAAESEDVGDDEEEDSEDSEDEDDDEDDDVEDVDPEEMERQGKREKAMQKAIKHLLTKSFPDGFPLVEFDEKLASIKVTGFAPEKCGYRSVEKFFRGQPAALCRYDQKTHMVLAPMK